MSPFKKKQKKTNVIDFDSQTNVHILVIESNLKGRFQQKFTIIYHSTQFAGLGLEISLKLASPAL